MNTDTMVHEFKSKLCSLFPRVKLAHVKAHIGIAGNELADTLAKEGTKHQSPDVTLAAPRSFLISKLKRTLAKEWQNTWNISEKGRYTYKLLPKTRPNNFRLEPTVTAFLSGHGPFPAYLEKFRIARTARCDCGEEGGTSLLL